MPKKRMPAAERQQETGAVMPGSSRRGRRITGRIPGLVPGRESALTWAGELLKRCGQRPPEPKGKLDAMTGYSFSTPVWEGGQWVVPAVAEVTVKRPG